MSKGGFTYTVPTIPSVNPQTGLVEQYAVFNTSLNQFVIPLSGDTLMSKEEAKSMARDFNAAMTPEYQTYTVVTVVFNPEV